MNILLLNWRDPRNPKSGGAETVTLEHAKAWVKDGHEVTWLANTFTGSKNTEIIEGITVLRKGNALTQFFWYPFYYFRMRNTIDIVVEEVHGLPYLTPLYVRKKLLVFIHEVAGSIWNRMFPFPLNKIGLLLEKISFHFYRGIPFFTVSESTKKDLLEMGVKNICVIHNGITIHRKTVPKENNFTFIFVSRLVKMKGVEDVIYAFHHIRKKEPTSVLWIVGEGEAHYVNELKGLVQQVGDSNSVVFWGRVSEDKKYELMGKAHLLLHASVKEGWGLVVLEAATQKTPAVVYNVHGLRDAVVHNKTGLIVKKNSPEALADEALNLLKNSSEYSQMQENAFQYTKTFSWNDATSKSLHLLLSL